MVEYKLNKQAAGVESSSQLSSPCQSSYNTMQTMHPPLSFTKAWQDRYQCLSYSIIIYTIMYIYTFCCILFFAILFYYILFYLFYSIKFYYILFTIIQYSTLQNFALSVTYRNPFGTLTYITKLFLENKIWF
jgi:hypothetical protein